MGIGEACAVASALTWSGGVILYKRLGEILPPLQLNLLKNVIVLLVLVPTLLLTPGIGWPSLPPSAIALTLLSGVILVTRRKAEKVLDAKQLRAGVLYGAAAVILMAVAIVMVKRVLEGQPLLWVVTLRLLGGAIGLAGAFFWRGEPLLSKDPALPRLRWSILVAGALLGQYVSMMLWLAGYKYTQASVAAILNETSSIFIVLLAWLFLREGLGMRKIAGVCCTMSGVACMLLA